MNITMNLKNSNGRSLEAALLNNGSTEKDEEAVMKELIDGYVKDGKLNSELGKQLLYRISIIKLMEEQGQLHEAVAYLEDLQGYISAPAIVQQGLITEEALGEINAAAQRWIEELKDK